MPNRRARRDGAAAALDEGRFLGRGWRRGVVGGRRQSRPHRSWSRRGRGPRVGYPPTPRPPVRRKGQSAAPSRRAVPNFLFPSSLIRIIRRGSGLTHPLTLSCLSQIDALLVERRNRHIFGGFRGILFLDGGRILLPSDSTKCALSTSIYEHLKRIKRKKI